MGRILTIVVALITMGTAAHATTLAAGALYGGATQNLAVCYLYNAGDSQVAVFSNSQIVREGAGPVTLTAQNCITNELGGLLNSGAICYIAANIVNNASHACEFFSDPDGAEVRGELDIRGGSGSGTVLQVEQLR